MIKKKGNWWGRGEGRPPSAGGGGDSLLRRSTEAGGGKKSKKKEIRILLGINDARVPNFTKNHEELRTTREPGKATQPSEK